MPPDDIPPDDSTLHVTRDLLRAIHDGRLPPRALILIGLEHLASICPHCRIELARFREDRRRALTAGPEGFEEAFRSLEEVMERHSTELAEQSDTADRLVAEILAMEPKARLERLRSQDRYARPLVVRRLIDRARQAMPAEPEQVMHLTQAACALAERMTERAPGRGGMMAEALGILGNAQRVLGFFEEARAIFRLAQETFAEEGITDPLVYAELDSFRASLARDVGQLGEAARLATRAATVYAGLAEVELAAKCNIQLGYVHYQAGRYREALAAQQRALRHLGRDADRRLYWCARHNQILCLVELGEMTEAARRFEEDEDLRASFDDAWTRLRCDWLAGRLLAESQPDDAIRLLQLTRSACLAAHSIYDSVLVSLDLAQVLVRHGRRAELEELAGELSTQLRQHGADLPRETLSVLRTVLSAVASGAVTADALTDAAATLRRQRRPRRARPS